MKRAFSAGYGRSLGKINIGALFNYNIISIANFEKQSAISFEFATVYQLSSNFFTGLQISNQKLRPRRVIIWLQISGLDLGSKHLPKFI